MVTSYAPDEVGLADKSPCASIRADLKMCLLESDCCRKQKKTPRECLKENLVPDECTQLRQIFFECKRSLVSKGASLYKYASPTTDGSTVILERTNGVLSRLYKDSLTTEEDLGGTKATSIVNKVFPIHSKT